MLLVNTFVLLLFIFGCIGICLSLIGELVDKDENDYTSEETE